LDEVINRLSDPAVGSEAAELLADLGAPGAVMPLSMAAAHGVTPKVRHAAKQALGELVQRPSARPTAVRLLQSTPKGQVRQELAAALGPLSEDDAAESAPETGEPDPRDGESPYGRYEPDPTRVVYGPTAFGRRAGTFNGTIYNVVYWLLDYGISENVEVGFHTVPPIGVVGVLPHVKVTFPLGSAARLGLYATGGVIYPYIDNDEDVHLLLYGGGPVLTFGDPDLLLNLSVMVNGGSIGEKDIIYGTLGAPEDTKFDYSHAWTVTPNLGFGWRFHDWMKLNAELFVPSSNDSNINGKLWVLLYGVRMFGDSIYGDINFVLPFWPEMWDIMKYMPIGFPLLSFGFQW
jgi:hypothetical protein